MPYFLPAPQAATYTSPLTGATVTLSVLNGVETNLEVENPSVILPYQVGGSEADLDVEFAVQAFLVANNLQESYALENGRVVFLRGYTKKHVGGGLWEGQIRYDGTEPKQPGDQAFTADTSGGTANIKQSLGSTTWAKDTSGSVTQTEEPDGSPINDDGQAVAGVDVTVPQFQFSVTKYVAVADLDRDYIKDCYELTHCTNEAVFTVTLPAEPPVTLTFEPGEVLLLGVIMNQKGLEDYEFTFKFAASPNKDGITIGDFTDIDKGGWEYVDVKYSQVRDSTTGTLVNTPSRVRVHRVYPDGDFTVLGIS